MPQVKVKIPTMLRATVGGERVVAGQGATLRALLADVNARHPGFAVQLLNPRTGELQPFVNVYLNDEDVRYMGRLETPVEEGDIVSILPAVAGGLS